MKDEGYGFTKHDFIKKELWITESCGNRYDANSVEGISHAGAYETRITTDYDKDYVKTICPICAVYWEKELKKIEPKNN